VFATLIGGLPRPPLPETASEDDLVAAAVRAQVEVGLEPVTDGRLRWPDRYADGIALLEGIVRDAATGRLRVEGRIRRSTPLTVDAWRFAADLTDRAVKQALPGPYTLGRRLAATGSPFGDRVDVTLALARALGHEVLDLAAAGCPLVEVEERDGSAVGDDEAERALFRAAHDALTEDFGGETHLSLALTGPAADRAGAPTALHPAYASFAFDLVEGPGGWRLIALAPGDRGIVCGAVATRPDKPSGPEVLVYAASYAASTAGRGLDRVGLAVAGGLEGLEWAVAERLMRDLGEGARIAAMPAGPDKASRLDPRAIDIRSAALGRYEPATKRGRRPHRGA
jgi:methionine synthase II (cobalamin-independent)